MIKLILLAALMAASALADSSYERTITEWRQKREKSLQADGGWLTVTGLLWLKEGENRAGSDRSNDIVLPLELTTSTAGPPVALISD